MEKVTDNEKIVYKDDRMIIIDNSNVTDTLNTSPIKSEWFVALLCIEGESTIYINNEMYSIHKNDFLLCHPQTIFEHKITNLDFKYCGFFLSPEYVKQISLISSNSWNAILFVENNPIIALDEKESSLFLQYYNLIRSKFETESQHHLKQLIDMLLQAFIYEFHDSMEKRIKIDPPQYNSADNLFISFLDILVNSYPKQRSVSYYAEKLFVTPKYLSAICKEISGETASDLITRYVKKDIENLLKQPNKTIKEIANELDFANLSFFGKYVKRIFGVSPKEYRENIKYYF
ncbi:AraC family transcriptional regulator [Bacteroides caecigallinarum]|uniref:helix-turn-helix domain-containing protein n=1 Tax=Bacteroides caecigallinarum TaxID=1411144 RepID=UPI00195CFBC6|nr:helix-turn-helix domain-containing protein [Bacteroides caecigallinarum]MBM6864068.1 AraC family transcriptional regulator [Bacteroides caecigallinarum]